MLIGVTIGKIVFYFIGEKVEKFSYIYAHPKFEERGSYVNLRNATFITFLQHFITNHKS